MPFGAFGCGRSALMGEAAGTIKQSPGQRAGPAPPRPDDEAPKDGHRTNPRPWWPANMIGRVRGWQSAETVKNSVVGNGEIFCTHGWRG
jgi:hypothetical protein